VGINVIYSGTVAAAIEAAFLGLPAIAASLLLRNDVPIDYARASALARSTIEEILRRGLSPGEVGSINIPALRAADQPAGVKVCRQCTRPYSDSYEQRQSPRGQTYYWNSSIFTLQESERDTDVAYLREGYITVTPLQFDLTSDRVLRRWGERA
jgi:5'-nucleotidase